MMYVKMIIKKLKDIVKMMYVKMIIKKLYLY